MGAFATPARIFAVLVALAAPAVAKPLERQLNSDTIEASSFLSTYHPNYVADDDPQTAWVEGATSSGAGEWLRVQLTYLEQTTRVRLRVRNGLQKSKDLWKANARAKAVTVRLQPSRIQKQITLTDTDGWQEIVVDQPSGPLQAVVLAIDSVYEGSRSADLGISDVQVFATSEASDTPWHEKRKHDDVMSWRSSHLAAAKLYSARQAELPIYPAYQIKMELMKGDDSAIQLDEFIAVAAKDPVFAKEWKAPLAVASALARNPGSMTRAQIVPASPTQLVAVTGLQIAGISDPQSGPGGRPAMSAIRLPMLGLVSAMFADQLRVLDVKDGLTIAQFQRPQKGCGPDVAWVSRTQPKEGPSRVSAVAIGRCARLEGRAGPYLKRAIELMIYDPTGKLVLLAGDGHIEGYRWTTEAGKPMLEGGRSLVTPLYDNTISIEAKRSTVPAK